MIEAALHDGCVMLFSGIERLRGFERLVNLEALWLDHNKLQYINSLDANFRIKALYAQVCARGSYLGSFCIFRFEIWV